MSNLVFDIEANGLLHNVSQIHCVATHNLDDGTNAFYPPDRLAEGIVALRDAERLIGHNIIGYDLKAIWKILGEWEEFPLITDTLVVSRALFPERKGGHGLAAWGAALGFPKGDQPEDWSAYTEDMGRYCQQDVQVNVRVLRALEAEMEAHYGEQLEGYKVY